MFMMKPVFALLRTFLLAALVPALSLSLVACSPDDLGGTDNDSTSVNSGVVDKDEKPSDDVTEGGVADDGEKPSDDVTEGGVADDGEKPSDGTTDDGVGDTPEDGTSAIVVGEAVDLGLSVKWASCNVGAESPEGYGDYFAWGETSPKSSYSSSNSVTYGLSISTLESRGIIGSDGNLTAAYDAATANWGGNWRMPTLDEMQELINNCTWEWTSVNGVNGRLVTGPNGNSIFLPAAGFRDDTSLIHAGSNGLYWSATPDSISMYAYYLYFTWGRYVWDLGRRYYGCAVRPVSDK
jgi:hypothetical protein